MRPVSAILIALGTLAALTVGISFLLRESERADMEPVVDQGGPELSAGESNRTLEAALQSPRASGSTPLDRSEGEPNKVPDIFASQPHPPELPFDKRQDELFFETKYAYLRNTTDAIQAMGEAVQSVKKEVTDGLVEEARNLYKEGNYQSYPYSFDSAGVRLPLRDNPNVPKGLAARTVSPGIDDDFRIRVWLDAPELGEHILVTLDPAEHLERYMKAREASWLIERMTDPDWLKR